MKQEEEEKEEEEEEKEEEEEDEEKELRWRNGHILQSIKNHKTCAIHLNN